MYTLVVTNPFGGREIGEKITDTDEIKAILASEHGHHVVRVAATDSQEQQEKKEE